LSTQIEPVLPTSSNFISWLNKKISDLRKENEIGPYTHTLNEKFTAGTLDLMGFLTNFKSQLAHIEEEMIIFLTL
jgi:hypothetical protein